MKTRMALVGHNCMVSRFPDGVSVGTGIKGLSNLCDENLDNYCDLPGVADVTLLAGSPIVAVKDMKHYFDKDTKAGFKISVESSVLKLNVLENSYHIYFYKDGKFLKDSKIEQRGFSVLNLAVGDIGLGSTMDIVAQEQPTEDYDEIALVGQSGLNVSAVKGLKIYYAFVGDGEYTLTKSAIKKYDSYFNTNIQLTPKTSDALAKNLTDDDTSNGSALGIIASVGAGYAQVVAKDKKSTGETFPEGTEAGFVYTITSLLSVADTPVLTLLDRNGNKIYEKALSTQVLSLDLGGGKRKISIKAPCAFSGIKIQVEGLKFGVVSTAQYAFVIPKPTTAGHQCTMSPTASLDICSCDEKYVLNWDKKNYPNASWKMVSTTDDNVTFDEANYTLDFSKSKAYLEGNGAKATVVMKLTNTDDCSQQITINYGGNNQPVEKKEMALVNTDPAKPAYELGDGSSYGLNILSIVKNSANIISSKLNSFASYFGGVSIGESYLCSVKKTEGMISDGSKALQAGFVVTAKGSALTADVLKLMNVKIYYQGKEVGHQINTAAIAAKLIGSEDTHKLRYSIKVPEGTKFDEIRLYSDGLLGAKLSVMNIYYAYTADVDAILDDPTEGAEIVSFDNNGASINADRTQSAGVLKAGNGMKDLTNCIDGSLETCTTFPMGAEAGVGSILAVKLGVTATRNKQLVVVVNQAALGVGVDLGSGIVVKTYKKKEAAADPAKAYKADEQGSEDSQKTDDSDVVETFSDWSILGANLITRGDKGFVVLTPTKDYDEVSITQGAAVQIAESLKVYGILLRNDADGDGTPDTEMPSEDCKQDIVFDENVHISDKSGKRYKQNLTMYFKRTFVPGQWNSVILPVNLTKAQFVEAFGATAKLSEAREVYQDEKSLVIGFKAVEETVVDGQTVYLKANKPYIIWVDKATVAAHQNKTFTTTDAGSIMGEIYMVDKTQVDGVSYTYNEATALKPVSEPFPIGEGIDASWGLTGLQFQASYEPAQSLAIGDYGWNAGNLYHLRKAHTMKGYRCWLTPTWASASQSQTTLSFGFGQGDVTGLETVSSADEQGELKVFNLQGQRLSSLEGVQPGIYIVNGKKMVVK
uniref:hypothetical protein n=1 Tax=Prevotella sp. TaxID=59823 RepID=UPI003FEF6AEB